MLLNKDQADKVIGEIYKITNIVTNKCYIGQTRSHRLNHSKYRPFGHKGRFIDHIHEAHSNKKNQSWYLNASILKYGAENFKCELLTTCQVKDLNDYETKFILENNSKYPNGYNLTNGGQVFTDVSAIESRQPPIICEKNTKRSDKTKQLISDRLKVCLSDTTHRKHMMKCGQKQHLDKKFAKLKDVSVDEMKIEEYLSIIRDNKTNTEYIRVTIDGIRTTFVGKYETVEEIKERAKLFICDLVKWQRDQIAGNPLEPQLPLTLRNFSEELG
jgi:group I intron endonuclease